MTQTIVLKDLDQKHPGISLGIGLAYCEAARVCLDRHHSPPHALTVTDNGTSISVAVNWEIADARLRTAWANADDATRDGAYAVAIAAAEVTRGLVAIARAETKTGADYYLGPSDSVPLNLEAAIRLEVSGIDKGNASAINARLKVKADQTKAGKSSLPAIASVVGFQPALVVSVDVQI